MNPNQVPPYAQTTPHCNIPPPAPFANAPNPTVIIQGPPQLGPEPQRITCPACHASVLTRTEKDASCATHIAAILLLGMLCCCIPYCAECFYKTDHYCSNCQAYIGQNNPF